MIPFFNSLLIDHQQTARSLDQLDDNQVSCSTCFSFALQAIILGIPQSLETSRDTQSIADEQKTKCYFSKYITHIRDSVKLKIRVEYIFDKNGEQRSMTSSSWVKIVYSLHI
ncbi:hypothetical protein D917_02614 [Trichinella nativa]|uniref:Uncharacterized protein n=1 Tax=Trichinella nativa TaxID=6335 RepID=A0A1Y3EGK5_9BILA|nr:hypothetical protein D917_02614 [Trichinella nativa]